MIQFKLKQDFKDWNPLFKTYLPIIYPFNITWLHLKFKMNKWKISVDYSNLYTVVSLMKALLFNIIEITDSVQSDISKYFVVIKLANMFSAVIILTASQLQFAFKFKEPLFTFTLTTYGILQQHCHITQSWQKRMYAHSIFSRSTVMTLYQWHTLSRRFIWKIHSGHTEAHRGALPKDMGHWPPIVLGYTILVKFLKITWSVKGCSVINTIEKLILISSSPSMLIWAKYLSGIFMFWSNTIYWFINFT